VLPNYQQIISTNQGTNELNTAETALDNFIWKSKYFGEFVTKISLIRKMMSIEKYFYIRNGFALET